MRSRTDALLQVWQPRYNGWKPTRHIELHYQSGQSDPPEYLVKLANHGNFPTSPPYPNDTGRITFALADAFWQGNKIQAKEIFMADPNSLSMDTTLDGAYANLHGFKVESIVAGGYRVLQVKINGASLTFDDQLIEVAMAFPSAA